MALFIFYKNPLGGESTNAFVSSAESRECSFFPPFITFRLFVCLFFSLSAGPVMSQKLAFFSFNFVTICMKQVSVALANYLNV